jgi:hypothetical protein
MILGFAAIYVVGSLLLLRVLTGEWPDWIVPGSHAIGAPESELAALVERPSPADRVRRLRTWWNDARRAPAFVRPTDDYAETQLLAVVERGARR